MMMRMSRGWFSSHVSPPVRHRARRSNNVVFLSTFCISLPQSSRNSQPQSGARAGGHGNALFVLAGHKSKIQLNLWKIAKNSLLINTILLSGAPEASFLRKKIDFFNYLFPGKRLGAISQKLGIWNFAIAAQDVRAQSVMFVLSKTISMSNKNKKKLFYYCGQQWHNSNFPVSDLSPPSVFRETNN